MITRRNFLKDSTSAAAVGLLATSALSRAAETPANNSVLKVGLIGCGGIAFWAHLRSLRSLQRFQLIVAADGREIASRQSFLWAKPTP